MKKIGLVTLMLVISAMASFAQNHTDILRYSQIYPQSSARSAALSGAFCALGGDMAAITINPASVAVYRKKDFSFTIESLTIDTKSTFRENSEKTSESRLPITNIGFVSTNIINNSETKWKAINFGISFNRLNDYKNDIEIAGTNSTSSMAGYFIDKANAGSMNAFAEQLAYDAYLINFDEEADEYWSHITDDAKYNQKQIRKIQTSGGLNEIALSLGGNYDNSFFIGGSIGIQLLQYEEKWTHQEIDQNDNIYMFNDFQYKQHVETQGTGYNLSLGAIYKPTNWLRIGAAIHSPTYFNIEENYSNQLTTSFDNDDAYIANSPAGVYEYEITTPYRANLGLAFVFLKTALLSVDYDYIDYTRSKLDGSTTNHSDVNKNIESQLSTAHNLRFGAEYKLNSIYFRGGAALYGNPYNADIQDASRISLSAGLGFRFDGFYIETAFINTKYEDKLFLYDVYEDVQKVDALINNTKNEFLITMGFRF